MATFDDERDDAALDEEELRSAPGQWNRPLLMAGLGLALMLVGYAATVYVPVPTQAEQERRLAELRQRSAQHPANGGEDASPQRSEERVQPGRYPPYQMAGRLAIYGGLFLFVMAGVLMYRSSPPPSKDFEERE
jgi:hypothetical protein